LSNIVIVDDSLYIHWLNMDNWLPVKMWTGKRNDTELLEVVLPLLQAIDSSPGDVRKDQALKQHRSSFVYANPPPMPMVKKASPPRNSGRALPTPPVPARAGQQ
jgi:hypothetical protein